MDHQELQLLHASQRCVCDLVDAVEPETTKPSSLCHVLHEYSRLKSEEDHSPQVHAFHVFGHGGGDGDEGAEGAVQLSGPGAGAGSGAGTRGDMG